MLNAPRPSRAPLAGKFVVAAALAGALISSSACSDDEAAPGSPEGGTGGGDETGGSGGKSSAGAAGTANTGGKAGSGGTSGGGAGAGGASGGGAGDSGTCTGGPSTGTNDPDHCKSADGGAITQVIGACVMGVEDAGAEPGDGGDVDDYGDTLYGTEGDDDDCKYHVKYTVMPICQDEGVTFVITLTKTADGKAATGAAPYVEATLNGLPASVADKQKVTEKSGGVYEVGPVVFDKPGKWNTRFHFFESCSDSEDSPHGHVAFFMDVP